MVQMATKGKAFVCVSAHLKTTRMRLECAISFKYDISQQRIHFSGGAHLLTLACNIFCRDSSDPIQEATEMLRSGAFGALLCGLGQRTGVSAF